MRHFIIYFSTILFLATLSSCEDFLETTLELDPPPFEKNIVILAEAKAGDSVVVVRLTENFGILDDDKIATLKNPMASFTVDGQSQKIISTEISNGYHIITFALNTPLNVGQHCQIVASHDGFPDASAEQTVPDYVPLTKAKYIENGGISTDGSELSKIDVNFKDPQGKNYYEATVLLRQNFNNNYFYPLTTMLNEPGASEGLDYYSVIFNDLSFENQNKDLSLTFYKYTTNNASEDFKVVWKTVGETYYKYSKTTRTYYDSNENPFLTPTSVYSNVEGGLGIFHIYTETEYMVE